MKKQFLTLIAVSLSVLSLVLASPALVSAQSNDYWRQQQQQQMQQEQQRRWQQQQDDMRRQQQEQMRQQQIEQARRQQQEQMRQQQMQEQIRQQQQAQQRQQQQQQAQQRQLQLQQQQQATQRQNQQQQAQQRLQQQQTQQRQQTADQQRQQMRQQGRLGTAQPAQITKAPWNPTPGEIQKGFTGRVTADGRALIRFQNRILAVPASRVSGLSAKLAAENQRKTNWTAQQKSSINEKVKALAEWKSWGKTPAKSTSGSGGRDSDKNGGNDKTGQQERERLLWTSWASYPKVNEAGNEYAKIGDRLYTRHAVDRMQPSGLGAAAGIGKDKSPGRSFPPNLVEEVIRNGSQKTVTTINGVTRTIHSSGTAEVVTEQEGKIVVTVNPFRGE